MSPVRAKRFLFGQAVVLVLTVLVVGFVTTVTPSAYQVFDSVLCPEGRPVGDVEESFGEGRDGGVATTWTLECVGADGSTEDAGALVPVLLLFVPTLLFFEGLAVLSALQHRSQRRQAGPAGVPGAGRPKAAFTLDLSRFRR